MKTTIFRTLLLLFLSVGLLTACDSDDEDAAPSNTDLLTSEVWKGDEILVNGLDPRLIPGAANYVPDAKSIAIKFEQDGTYTGEYMQNGQLISTKGEWEFTENETKLSGQLFNLPATEADIDELTATELTLSTMLIIPNVPIPVKAEIRLVR